MKHLLTGGLALALCATTASTAHAWGSRGHAVIDRAAVLALPADGPAFLRNHIDYIADSASIPDGWRSSSEPFSKIAEDPNHGWFQERFAFLKSVPRSRHAFTLALYRENQRLRQSDPEAATRMNVRWAGTMPYAVMETYGNLVAGFRKQRALKAAGQGTRSIEQTCAFYVAWMGHYLGDGAQPMHASWHSDGWFGPNPSGYSRDGQIHGRFESKFVDAIALTPLDIADRIGAPAHQDGDLFDVVLAYLRGSGSKVEQVFAMDKRGAFADPEDQEARELVYSQTAAGAAMLRDLVHRAWIESAAPGQGAVRPHLPDAPGYDAETGSAPPAR